MTQQFGARRPPGKSGAARASLMAQPSLPGAQWRAQCTRLEGWEMTTATAQRVDYATIGGAAPGGSGAAHALLTLVCLDGASLIAKDVTKRGRTRQDGWGMAKGTAQRSDSAMLVLVEATRLTRCQYLFASTARPLCAREATTHTISQEG